MPQSEEEDDKATVCSVQNKMIQALLTVYGALFNHTQVSEKQDQSNLDKVSAIAVPNCLAF